MAATGKVDNSDTTATRGWVRQQLADQPKQLYESAKAKASEGGKSGMIWGFVVLTLALFSTGSAFAGLLANDLEARQGGSNSSIVDWRHDKQKRLIVSGFTTCFGFVALAITLGLLVSAENLILQNQNRIAIGMAAFALLISILIYMIAIRTRTMKSS
jgi:hypothetical protein